jgi:Glycosyl transferases group 1
VPEQPAPVASGAAGLRICLWGNHQPGFHPGPTHPTRWATEVHLALSLESLGHTVERLQEGEVRAVDVRQRARDFGAHLFVWVQTYGLAVTGGTSEERHQAISDMRASGIPTLSYHLDKWWDVRDGRADRIPTEAFFRTDLLATADEGGGRWQEAGINAVWCPPAVYHAEAVSGTPRPEYRAPVAFVGSWRGHYHPEWTHRMDLVNHLQRRWPQTGFWPKREQIRGAALSDLYASVDVVVGDSFMTPGSKAFHSDRIPETLGRGGFLLHPYNEGLEDLYQDGVHLRYWPLGDWAELDRLIAHYLKHEDERRRIAAQGQAHVRENHTYQRRLGWVVPMARDAHERRKVAVP